MPELVPYLASYGLPGLLIAACGWAVYRLIDRGFDLRLRIPPGEE